MDARKELEAAHRQMTPAEIAEHALFLADMLSRAHRRVLPSMTTLTNCQRALVEAQRNALVSLNGAVRGALELLDSGQVGKAREILAKLSETAIPVSTPLTVTEIPPLPDNIFSPGAKADPSGVEA